MPTPAPHAHQVKVRDTATGHVFEAWPVDARELVKSADKRYQYAPDGAPLGAPDAPVEPPAAPPTIAEQLAAKSAKELQALAKRAGFDPKQSKDAIIAELLPHIEGGAVSLEELAPLAPPPASFPSVE